MLLEAVYHRPKSNWAYAYDERTIHLRLRTKRDDVERVTLIVGDKYAWDRTVEELPMTKWVSDALFDYWHVAVQPLMRRMKYAFRLESEEETVWFVETGMVSDAPKDSIKMFDFPFLNPVDVFAPPAWVKDAIFYQIFPERFANGDPGNDPEGMEPWGGEPTPKNYFGGDLQGVIDHLDHLSALGVNAIYFNPVFRATTNHKYDTADYMTVDPHFGTNETLKKLVEACHERGIRVLLDAVFNHCGHTFPPFLDVKEKGPDSRYAGWFHVREWPLDVKDGIPTYDTFAYEPIMPKLNTEHPEVKEYLLKVAKYWIEEVDIDGWRLDVANEVDHRFWREFRDVVKKAKPDAYILGEIMHDSMPWLMGDQFDAVMNYPLTNIIIEFAAKKERDGASFAYALGALLASYPQQANEAAFNLLGSHDTVRLLTLCDEDKQRMKLATLLQFTLTGTPCVYYGDEIGLTGDYDPGCRKCMEWDEEKQDRELFAFFRQVIALRKQYEALRTGDMTFRFAQENDMRLAYERSLGSDRFIVAVNAGSAADTLILPVDRDRWKDHLTEEELIADSGELHLRLPANGFRLLLAQ
ncbi:cyclomaltodextrinase [Paenibacillus sp. A3]|uniref:glycoside hydrolase family 13 protein n=1 Tax=Paenibacillus sp. A3 TaxID=1337054 RepID=UPI0006D588B2|nr:glycoside hydrolase family 13 protein [Paenibacillus sp. A3]KPV59974.1 cyclomaltodextrinase [Paenibacillus sp. A3]